MRVLHRLGVVLALACVAHPPAPASAAWVPLGNPVCTAAGEQLGANLAPDGSGGAFVVWMDRRRGYPPNTDLYATRVLADGSIAPGWPANGAVLAATGLVTLPSLAPDGAGGLMVFWFDQSTYQARMQHVDGTGARWAGFPADGMILPIVVGGPTGYVVRALTDEAGGAYFLWNNFNGTSDVFRLTRLTGDGGFVSGWNSSGVAQAFSDGFNPFLGFTGVVLRSDPAGGVLFAATWLVEDFPSGSHVVGLVRSTLANGASPFSGFLYPPDVGHPLSLDSDGAGGMFVAWATSEAPTRRMQHYLSNGTAAWPNPTAAPVSNVLFGDGSGGFYLLGNQPGVGVLELHRRAADGSIPPPWTASGYSPSNPGGANPYAGTRSGDLVYLSWSASTPTLGSDLWAVAVTPDGEVAPGWNANGMRVCNAIDDQLLDSMMPVAPDKAMIAWTDLRAGSQNRDIYVTLLERNGPVTLDAPGAVAGPSALAFASRSPSPNPARGSVEFAFTLPAAGDASLEILDVTGRVRERLEAEPRAGSQALSLDVARLPAGLYWARLRQGTALAATRFSVVH